MFGSKHKGTNREPRIDDVVILDEDNFASRGQWPLAVIIDIIRSRDGSTRSVILRTSAGREIQRPLNRIIPLEIQAVGNASNKDVASPESGVLARVKKVLKNKRVSDKPELWKQPPRTAKKPMNYKDSDQTSSHITKKNVTNMSSSAVTMIMLTDLHFSASTPQWLKQSYARIKEYYSIARRQRNRKFA
ncbi:hypothetical protein ANCCAN_21257 [Ancylostoma caninum]|uniref:DUF5641 domain-containing protein n=1 Tax=Ancylostoma caninum TaxID=29170 RepID=A0A368FPI0_ANCCA|nr:hypothetical protein ANCCAN_21257 [Ancylostoma caninum]